VVAGVGVRRDCAWRARRGPLLESPLVIWRGADGVVHAFADRCPHRGARLSLGRVVGDAIRCGYHGWRFDGDARCTAWPAHPSLAPPASAAATAYRATERYGLVWVALETPAADVPVFPPYDAPGTRAYVDGPYDFAACAPRVVENFLDMAHFPFVHAGSLGAEPFTEVKDYEVIATEAGLETRGGRFWQPQPSGLAAEGAEVEYTYRVIHPLVASLGKLPGRPDAFDILLATSPIDATHTRVWKVNVFADGDDARVERFAAFSRAAMLQDRPIVESQSPKPLPLEPSAEAHQRADRLSAAYRRYLAASGLTYGVEPLQQR
jgi:phenylpropionate dioxygenase-like ring-hydroxylating dioxygenase large terminal subunit